MRLEYDKKKLSEYVEKIVKRTMRMDLTWDWPCGVAYYGVAKAYEVTEKKEYLDLLKNRIDEHIEIGVPKNFTVNTCAMGHCLITLYQVTKEEKYAELIRRKVDYIRNHALRFGDQVLQHTVSQENDFPEQCWADTLFMAAYFLLRVGVLEENQELIQDALNQYYWHIRFLQNEESGIWYHGYENSTKSHMSGVYWGRANAWAAYTMSQVEGVLPKCYLYPQYMDICGSLDEQLSSLKLLQTPNGCWRTILDDPDSYEEISASCGIAAAMIARGNPLHSKYVNKLLDNIGKHISKDGKVLNVSGGTAVMNNPEGYKKISTHWIQGWGQGLALVFLSNAMNS